MTSAFSWQNSISLFPASFCTPRSNLSITPGVSWLCIFSFPSPIIKRTSFGVLVLVGLVGLHRTIKFQLLQHYCSGHRLGLPWYWMVCLGNERRSFCHFWDCIQVLHFGLLLTMMASPFLLRDSCPQNLRDFSFKRFLTVDIMVIWVKFTHSSSFWFTDS